MLQINRVILHSLVFILVFLKPAFSDDVPVSLFSDPVFSDPLKFFNDNLNQRFPPFFLTPDQRDMIDRLRKNRLGIKIRSESLGHGKPVMRKYKIVGFVEVGAGKVFVALEGVGLVSLTRIFGRNKLIVNKVGYRTLSVSVNGVRQELTVGEKVALKM
ncbi:hypothetical protein [Sulfurivirga caldicuralii]|uniref:hypothetical protein n=1 Tax=Sulfurivirga caldicuralii TaxID=364032 RepID=UPI00117FC32F|nr:hypothetical protein [Sulfurivirga caldicuralii]